VVEWISWGDRHSSFCALLAIYQQMHGHPWVRRRCVAYVAHGQRARWTGLSRATPKESMSSRSDSTVGIHARPACSSTGFSNRRWITTLSATERLSQTVATEW